MCVSEGLPEVQPCICSKPSLLCELSASRKKMLFKRHFLLTSQKQLKLKPANVRGSVILPGGPVIFQTNILLRMFSLNLCLPYAAKLAFSWILSAGEQILSSWLKAFRGYVVCAVPFFSLFIYLPLTLFLYFLFDFFFLFLILFDSFFLFLSFYRFF